MILLTVIGINLFRIFGNVNDYIANVFKPLLSSFVILLSSLSGKTIDEASQGTKELSDVSNKLVDTSVDSINNTSQKILSYITKSVSNNSTDVNYNTNNKNSNNTNNNTNTNNKTDNEYDKNTLGEMDTYNTKDLDKLSNFIDNNFDNVNKFNSTNNKECKRNCKVKCNNESNNEKCDYHCDRYCNEVLPEPDPVISNSRVQSNKGSGKSGFCYVGEENGIRSCVKVTEHDVCTSGKVYKSDEICKNPKLRE